MASKRIKTKLIKIIMKVSLASIVASSCCFMLWFSYIFKSNLEKTLEVQAEITAENCSAALAFEDKTEAANVLSSLKYNKNIAGCVLTNKSNEYFASYPAELNDSIDESDHLVIDYMINLEGEHMGSLRIYGSYSQFYNTMYYGAAAVTILVVVCFGFSYVLGERLQRLISGPILALKDTALHITKNQDYSMRMENNTEDELGDLADAFNEMLVQIQARDRELQSYNKELEDKVEERTSELEEAMVKAQHLAEKAQVANRAKSEFLANMSHELRTPMNAIIGFTSVMLSEEMDEQHMQYMKTIDVSARNLLRIINDILDFSKIEAGRMDIETVPYSIPHVLEEIRSEMNPSAVNKNITLRVMSEKNVSDMQLGDPLRIKQCLINLIGNSIKFTSEGSVTLIVGMDKESEDEKLTFKVIDTGIGIPKEKIALIFTSFSQADGSTCRKYGGTGLGLSITKNLVKLMGGTITVESEEGSGSTFTVTIPTTTLLEDNKSASLGSSANSGEMNTKGIFAGKKVLVAEDNISNQELVETFLKPTDAEFEIVGNGLEAVKKWLATKSYDVILMDMQMPVMSGYDAVIELRKSGCDIPILALTANAMQKDKEECIEVGCNCHVAKPLDKELFISVVKRYLIGAESKKSAVTRG